VKMYFFVIKNLGGASFFLSAPGPPKP